GDRTFTARDLGTLGAFTQAVDHTTTTDIDFYKFALSSTQTFTASAKAGSGGNVLFSLFRDLGSGSTSLLSELAGTDGFALIQQSLSPGNYFLRVLGFGTVSPDYTVGFSTGDNDDSIPEARLSKNSQAIVGD